jgi:hypothetical protein
MSLSEFIRQCDDAELNPDTFVDFNGRRYRAPFCCLCCGRQIKLAQFCYGRLCGSCDVGACQRGNRSFRKEAAHKHLPRDWHFEISEPAPVEVMPETVN